MAVFLVGVVLVLIVVFFVAVVLALVVVSVLVAVVLALVLLVVVAAEHLGVELQRRHVVAGGEHGRAVGLDRLQDVLESLLEFQTVGHDDVRLVEPGAVRHGRLVVVRIGERRQDGFHFGEAAAGDIARHVGPDGRGRHDQSWFRLGDLLGLCGGRRVGDRRGWIGSYRRRGFDAAGGILTGAASHQQRHHTGGRSQRATSDRSSPGLPVARTGRVPGCRRARRRAGGLERFQNENHTLMISTLVERIKHRRDRHVPVGPGRRGASGRV